jgi:hypothetical protein
MLRTHHGPFKAPLDQRADTDPIEAKRVTQAHGKLKSVDKEQDPRLVLVFPALLLDHLHLPIYCCLKLVDTLLPRKLDPFKPPYSQSLCPLQQSFHSHIQLLDYIPRP